MTATTVFIHLLGDIALLLWGIRMVHQGIVRAFGNELRRLLGRGLRNRMRAFLAGLAVTALLQSSTATGIMASSFAAAGVLELVPGLAILLGANVGTSLIIQAFSFDITLVFPLLILVGVIDGQKGGRLEERAAAAKGTTPAAGHGERHAA
jgi:phosphate:Na+ symporter